MSETNETPRQVVEALLKEWGLEEREGLQVREHLLWSSWCDEWLARFDEAVKRAERRE